MEGRNKAKKEKSPLNCLKLEIQKIIGEQWKEEMIREIPRSFVRHGDLVLIDGSSFSSPFWKGFESSIWEAVSSVLRCNRIAKKGSVLKDGFRTPSVSLLRGVDPWVVHKDNGILYTWDVTKCMFSTGNIGEKLRIASLDCSGETIVDLYAGIGYFVLPYLVHAKARHVHACEWNPHAIQALRKSLALNGIQDRCTVHEGDNRKVCPENVADRVNLGLIPSSEEGWVPACKALRRDVGGMLHVHGNVDLESHRPEEGKSPEGRKEWIRWADYVQGRIDEILRSECRLDRTVSRSGIHRVKSYGPRVDHLVLELHCNPA
ncbi:unnamed protein product [Darwinula stevensoni]|uniref:tRNA(Phe) (4-demethylwyosine(37)-C(7)) aminocarboxypropyltransferase n=1 Tax=Darwinula stevensoni TaxID=69355 RepID=A0A7R8XAC2_9CRUS|nr:unnamed protein product [Darwinula stevensoni]CAG0891796.1 unnamed protein product [Darwinula stevensoni]